MPAKQAHDIGRRKWNASADARRQAEQRRQRLRKLARRKSRKAARKVDPADIAGWRDAKRKGAA